MLLLTWKQNRREGSFSLWKYKALEDTPALCSLVVSCVYYSRLLASDAKKANHTSFGERENSFSYTTRHSKDRKSGKSESRYIPSCFSLPYLLFPSTNSICFRLPFISGLLLFFHKQVLKPRSTVFCFKPSLFIYQTSRKYSDWPYLGNASAPWVNPWGVRPWHQPGPGQVPTCRQNTGLANSTRTAWDGEGAVFQ